MLNLLALAAGAAFIVVAAFIARDTGGAARPRRWLLPAGLSVVFAAFSVIAVVREGPVGFWVEHTRNLWGNQIWFDLLLAAGVAWALMVRRARGVGMPPLPWLAAVACTGSIGLCAMLARILYLEEQGRPS
jgi:hypothetical protein